MKERLDKYIVNIGLIATRTRAKELIESNYVMVNKKVVNKCSYLVNDSDEITIIDNKYLKYVSRAGLKLERAIKSFNIDFNKRRIMDIGSSTGGFTDCSLKHGASKVIAIDVGTNLMVDSLRNDDRVELYEQLNIKDASSKLFNDVDIIVSDVSFISLKYVIDRVAKEDKEYELVFLIKPQFECGKDIATKFKGIIRDKEVHIKVLNDIISYFFDKCYSLMNLDVSPIHGRDGNIEYLGYFRKNKEFKHFNTESIVNKAFND